MQSSRRAVLALSFALLTACAESGDAVRPEPGPVTPAIERWRGSSTDDGPLPARVYFFPDEPRAGDGSEYRLDSALVTLRDDGTFVRRTWLSEWRSPDFRAGAPYELVFRAQDYDHGFWTRRGDALTLRSNWIQHQVIEGSFDGNGRLRLRQGLAPGDERFEVRFVRE